MDGQRTHSSSVAASGNQEELAMNAYLKSKGLYRKKIAKDGSCLFRAVAEQVLHSQAWHLEVRKSCIKYLRQNRAYFEAFIEGPFDEYLKRLENPQEWVGQVEISALSLMFKKEFVIYQEPDVAPARVTNNGFPEEIMLCFSNGNHYDLIYPARFSKDAALCQSIIYELLYEKVFGIDVTKLMSKTGASEEEVYDSGASGSDGEDNGTGNNSQNVNFAGMNGFKSHKDGKAPQEKASAVPAAVLRSLHPEVYRNVEYDVWMKSQRDQQKLDFSIAAGMQYSVGDKCKVRLEPGGGFYNAHIQEVVSNNGPAIVFVEELGEKKTVSLKNLKPVTTTISNSDDWNTVGVKKVKKQPTSGPVVQFEDYRTQKSLGKPSKAQSALPSRLQQASGSKQQQVLPTDQNPPSESKGRSRTPPKVPGRKLDRDRVEESSYYKRETVHFGLTPEERREKQVIEESKSLYEMQNRDTEAFPALTAVVDTAASSDVKKNPTLTREKSSRRKSEDDQRTKASKLTQPAAVDEKKASEEKLPSPAPPEEAVIVPDVAVSPVPDEQQTPTTVPSQPPVVTSWSGISAQMPACAGAGPESVLQPQVTPPFSPLPVSMPAVSQPLLPMPQTLSPYQDPLYPGFPVNEKGERITSPPPHSYCKNGSDLPNDKSILHFFYNLGIKAYTCPMYPPHFYLHPLHQAYLNMCRMYPNIHVYPPNNWMQEATVNQSEVDLPLYVHQNEVRNDNRSPQIAAVCSPAPLAPSIQGPVIVEPVSSQPNELEEVPLPGVNDFDGAQASKTMFPQPHFGQGAYMGHYSVAPPIFPQVWYGYPYQGYIENPVVQHNVFITPQGRNVPDDILPAAVVENSSVEGAIKQSQELTNECKPDRPSHSAADVTEGSGLNNRLVKSEEKTLDRPEIVGLMSLTDASTENLVTPSAVTKTSEEKESKDHEADQLPMETASVELHEDRPVKAKEESSEDEREVSNMLSSGRSKHFYNQTYGNRRPRYERFHPPNRGGYQYPRNDEAWRGARGREDGHPHYRNFRGRPYRRRPMGEPYRQHHE
ncbi:OTU domain-containing protein 4 [Hyperolius riggenbachi]|uniref:OTU domain-containing protein 4 n=1 Tax=Hyperolius riggenbachi TaxID=752182 RepID=UPI0035A35B88